MVRKKYSVSLHIFYESPPPKLVLQMLFFSPFYQWWNQNFGRFISVCSVKGSGNGTAWVNPRANWPQKLCPSLLPEGWKECLSCVLSSFEVVETVESRLRLFLYPNEISSNGINFHDWGKALLEVTFNDLV